MSTLTKNYIRYIALFWIVGTIVSFKLTQDQLQRSDKKIHLQTARAFIQQIVITREWNAKHGGVYVAISDAMQSNPFMDTSNQDIQIHDGSTLTLVNPAYMTRLLSEVAAERGHFQFRITSLKPLNPDNKPAEWEKAPMTAFENSEISEFYTYADHNDHLDYRYMIPLITKQSCLQCHAQQGYRVGDVRGAISLSMRVDPNTYPLLWISYALGGLLGLIIVYGFGSKILSLHNRLQRQAHFDGLTQISNRRYFDDYLHREWLRSRRNHKPFSLILCDVDYFKLYNDRYGHQAGDECLQRVAQSLERNMRRGGDLAARYGGEEFAVVLPETSGQGAMAVAESIRSKIEALNIPHENSKISDHVTISLGVCSIIGGQTSEKEMLALADKALYQSKTNGRNTTSLAEAE